MKCMECHTLHSVPEPRDSPRWDPLDPLGPVPPVLPSKNLYEGKPGKRVRMGPDGSRLRACQRNPVIDDYLVDFLSAHVAPLADALPDLLLTDRGHATS